MITENPAKIQTLVGPAHIKDPAKLQQKTMKREYTQYSIKKTKPNLMEMQRYLNKKKLKNTPKTKHSEGLYSRNKLQQEELNRLRQNKQKQVINTDLSHPYRPELDTRSVRIMSGAEQDYLERVSKWNESKHDKRLTRQQIKEHEDYQKDLEATIRPEYKKAHIQVDSRVKQVLETTTQRRNRSGSIKYKGEGSFERAPKGYQTLRLDRSKDNQKNLHILNNTGITGVKNKLNTTGELLKYYVS